jgi:hypothetical protein
MKKLEVNQMENLQGGSSACFAAMYAITAAIVSYQNDPSEWNLIQCGIAYSVCVDTCSQP